MHALGHTKSRLMFSSFSGVMVHIFLRTTRRMRNLWRGAVAFLLEVHAATGLVRFRFLRIAAASSELALVGWWRCS